MQKLTSHSAEKEGLVTVSHSIPKPAGSKTVRFEDVKYLLLDPHGGTQIPMAHDAGKYLPDDLQLLQSLIHKEKDAGIPELAEDILMRVPGGMAINVNFARAIIDANRTPEHAAGKIITPDAPADVKRILHDFHGKALAAIDDIIAQIPPGTKILCLHSMKTNYVDDIEVGHEIESIRSFIAAWEKSIGASAATPLCIIVGPEGEEGIADLGMKNAVAQVFQQQQIVSSVNDPFKTERNKHKTTDYMLTRPGDVLALDLPKDLLCTGQASDRTFSYMHSKADPAKVAKAGEAISEALKKVIRR
jgi:hypothetical protein